MAEKRRMFIAVVLPDDTREALRAKTDRWRWLPIRWIAPENWHLTVIPPFYADETEYAAVEASLRKAGRGITPFAVAFDSIVLAPPRKKARMIWFSGRESVLFERLKDTLKDTIEHYLAEARRVPRHSRSARPMTPHVTLARFAEGDLAELEAKTRILEKFDLSFIVSSVAIMESRLSRFGAEYAVRASFPLGEEKARPRYEFLPHPAGLRMRAFGRTPEELFENALLGMASYMKEGVIGLRASATRRFKVAAADAATLLVDFLSRALTLSDLHREVYPRVSFDEFSETEVKGTLFGASINAFDKDIKAVTHHDIEVKKTAAGYEATIVYNI